MKDSILFLNLRTDEKGATILEAAIGLLPFTLLMFGLLQVLSFAHTTMSMHYAVSKAARWGVLNETLVDANSVALTRVESIKQRFTEIAPRYGVNPDAVTIRVCPATNPGCATESAGAAGRSFIITAERGERYLTGFRFLQPRTSVIISNEPL